MIPGVRFPTTIQQPSLNDYGPKFAAQKIITIEPPKVLQGYKVLVPKSDAGGNDLGMLLAAGGGGSARNATPAGTCAARSVGADGMLTNLQGSFIPFATDGKSADPRRSVQDRYADAKAYRKQLDEACQRLIDARYILAEDRLRYDAHGTALVEFRNRKITSQTPR